MKLLFHTCCGPCASATIPVWRERGADVTAFFFNPNIHPLLEWRRRATGAQEVAAVTEVEAIVDPAYDPAAWFAAVVTGGVAARAGTGGDLAQAAGESRCRRCIGMRLDRTAQEAADRGCDAFSTSLSISPYQDHEAIRETGAEAAARHGVEFLYEDLRPMYGESRRLSREWGIYRQKYCGCLISEWERYRGS
jgi:predicted adenine nucleotide alpha hydrolase (AANH) superfamily ATPase